MKNLILFLSILFLTGCAQKRLSEHKIEQGGIPYTKVNRNGISSDYKNQNFVCSDSHKKIRKSKRAIKELSDIGWLYTNPDNGGFEPIKKEKKSKRANKKSSNTGWIYTSPETGGFEPILKEN